MTDNRQDSYQAMLAAVQCFHDKHQLQARARLRRPAPDGHRASFAIILAECDKS